MAEIVVNSRRGEAFLGDVPKCTLTKKARLYNDEDTIIYYIFYKNGRR
jgi:hypothetical protein